MVEMQENGYLAVDYIQLIPVIIESIKELNNKVENLNEIIKDLKK
jgi:hypothetical protein